MLRTRFTINRQSLTVSLETPAHTLLYQSALNPASSQTTQCLYMHIDCDDVALPHVCTRVTYVLLHVYMIHIQRCLQELGLMFRKFDKSGDGSVSFDEFIFALKVGYIHC